jgi:hypothetical protein
VTVTYEEWSNGISNNTEYYIMNQSSKLYIALWNTSDLDNTSVVAKDFISDDTFRWRTSLQANGSHKLISVASPTGKTLHVTGTTIDLYSNYGYATANFTIQRINDGANEGLHYIRYQDYYVAQASSNHVILTTTPSDAAVWHITAVSPGDAVIFGNDYYDVTKEIQFETNNCHSNFQNAFEGLGYTVNTYTNSSAQTAYPRLENSDVFVYFGHGQTALLSFHSSTGSSNGYIIADSRMMDSNDVYAVSSFENNALSDLRCVLYIGCQTGVNFGDYNLVDETYKKGGHFVLGVTIDATNANAKTWLDGFLGSIGSHRSIADAIIAGDAALDEKEINPAIKFPLYYIGDSKQHLNLE